MSLTLYHSVESTCAQKVRIVMAAKGLEWQEIRLNLRRGEQFSPEYLQLNPKAVVPTLVHDGQAIRESTVINEYLEDRFPEKPLRPADALSCARMRLLVKTIDEEVHPAIGILSYAIFLRHQMNEYMTPEQLQEHFTKVADPARRERQQSTHEKGLSAPAAGMAVRTLARFIEQLATALGEKSWLVGEEFTLADAAALPYMYRARALQLTPLWKNYGHVGPWLQRGEDEVSRLPLSQVFGSGSFHAMVAGHAAEEAQNIRMLLEAP